MASRASVRLQLKNSRHVCQPLGDPDNSVNRFTGVFQTIDHLMGDFPVRTAGQGRGLRPQNARFVLKSSLLT